MVDIKQNFLSPLEFRLVLKRIPHVTYFAQAANVPGMSFSPGVTPTPFKDIYRQGGKLEYNQFNVTVRVDENLHNYIEIINWMKGLSHPESFDQFKALNSSADGLYSDATLVILSSAKNPNIEITFNDVFPISLGDIVLDTTSPNVTYAVADITFQINGYSVKTVDT